MPLIQIHIISKDNQLYIVFILFNEFMGWWWFSGLITATLIIKRICICTSCNDFLSLLRLLPRIAWSVQKALAYNPWRKHFRCFSFLRAQCQSYFSKWVNGELLWIARDSRLKKGHTLFQLYCLFLKCLFVGHSFVVCFWVHTVVFNGNKNSEWGRAEELFIITNNIIIICVLRFQIDFFLSSLTMHTYPPSMMHFTQ